MFFIWLMCDHLSSIWGVWVTWNRRCARTSQCVSHFSWRQVQSLGKLRLSSTKCCSEDPEEVIKSIFPYVTKYLNKFRRRSSNSVDLRRRRWRAQIEQMFRWKFSMSSMHNKKQRFDGRAREVRREHRRWLIIMNVKMSSFVLKKLTAAKTSTFERI